MTCMRLTVLLLALASYCSPVLAVNIYQCKDSQGNISFQDRCPPGSSPVGEKQYSTNVPEGGAAKATAPLTLYVVPNCDSCKQVEDFLAARGISVNEKNVNDSIDLQNELKKAAGDLKVPALMVGGKAIVGYNRSAMLDALTKAGYNTRVSGEQ